MSDYRGFSLKLSSDTAGQHDTQTWIMGWHRIYTLSTHFFKVFMDRFYKLSDENLSLLSYE